MNNERGFILLLTFIFMIVLIALVGSLLFMVTYETRDMGAQIEDYKLLNLSEAGIQRAMREIRDEVLSGTPVVGVADLRGNTTTGTGTTMTGVRYYGDGSQCMLFNQSGRYVILSDFDLNYLENITNMPMAGSVIKSVKIGCRYKRVSSGGGSDVNLEITYTTTGTFPDPQSSSSDINVTSTSYNDPYSTFSTVLDITDDRAWTWPAINNSNFRIRARAHGSTNKDIYVEYLFLQVTYEIDTLKEGWATDNYPNTTFPIVLGSGKIQSVTVTDEAAVVAHLDEQGKVHLNTAPQPLLKNLMINLGIASATADTVATAIVNYRTNTKRFDSVEELQQVASAVPYYTQIRPYVTVYSFITPNAQNPTYLYGRAPVNINTAPYVILKAIFDPLGLGLNDPATLANDIITFRTATPFTCFYSADPAVTTDFYDFITTAPRTVYLTAAEGNIVLCNADSSLLPPMAGVAAVNGVTTEFCYSSNAFRIVSIADSDPNPAVQGRRLRVQTILGYDGSHTFPTFYGILPVNQDTTPVGYRKENYQ